MVPVATTVKVALLPWLTTSGNVELALELRGVQGSERRDMAYELLSRLHLQGFERRLPHELSGGMKHRVALARALAQDADVLLMDEPFASLDAITRDLLHDELVRLWTSTSLTVVFVTHSLDEALFLGDRIVLMGPRPGTVEEMLPVELPRPRWDYDFRATPQFLERRAYLWQRIRGMVADQPEFRFFPRDQSLATVSHT